jgi:RNA polymerase sigma factor (TIGR02999 family)
MTEFTQILCEIEGGDLAAAERLLPLIYDELRRLAARKMAEERKDHTWQATALVHEAYLKLVGAEAARQWHGRAHFFAAAAEAMRRVLIQQARRKKAEKRGGDGRRVDADLEQFAPLPPDERLLEIEEALQRLEKIDARKAGLVKLRYFVGLSVQEAADALGISKATAEREWTYVRSWLQCELKAADSV